MKRNVSGWLILDKPYDMTSTQAVGKVRAAVWKNLLLTLGESGWQGHAVGGAVLTGGSTAGTVGGAVVGGVIGHEVSKPKH